MAHDESGGPSLPAEGPPRTPTWVKVFAFVALALALVAILVVLFGGGEHGPRRHLDSDEHVPTTSGSASSAASTASESPTSEPSGTTTRDAGGTR